MMNNPTFHNWFDKLCTFTWPHNSSFTFPIILAFGPKYAAAKQKQYINGMRISRNSLYEIIIIIYEKIPKNPLAQLPIVLCHYCGLLCVSERRKRPIFWYGLHSIFVPISDKQPPIHSTKATALMFMDCLYLQYLSLSLSWISDTGLFALALFLTEKSIFRLWLKGWKHYKQKNSIVKLYWMA